MSGLQSHFFDDMKIIHRAFKIRVYPTIEQRKLFARTEGACRYVYNRALEEMSQSWQQKKEGTIKRSKTVIDMSRIMTQWKKQEETRWLADVPFSPLVCSLRALGTAFDRFFRNVSGYPCRHRRRMACSIQSQLDTRSPRAAQNWREGRVIFPGFGRIKLAQPERVPQEIPKMLALSRDASGRYFLAFQVEQPSIERADTGETVCVDLGVKTLAVLSTGEKIEHHPSIKTLRRRLKHAQRSLNRKRRHQKGRHRSNRYKKQQLKLAKIHCRMADARRDTQHKLTHDLTRRFDSIYLEDLNVKGMMRSARGTISHPGKNVAQKSGLNRAIADAGFGEIRRQIQYKAEWRGQTVSVVGRFAATTSTCSRCGTRKSPFSLAIRTWTCSQCGTFHDRDINAAVNIKNFATGILPWKPNLGPGRPEVMRVEALNPVLVEENPSTHNARVVEARTDVRPLLQPRIREVMARERHDDGLKP
jgi:putative transposase